MSCHCQSCGKNYKVDLVISNKLWEKIKPAGKPRGAGLLCGSCIMKRIEDISSYDAYKLINIKDFSLVGVKCEEKRSKKL